MDTDSFVLSFSEGNVDNEHMDLSNPEPSIKTNSKVPGKFKHELGNKENALMYNTERSVDECRIQKVGDNMTTTKTVKISLNTFDDKRF